MGRGPRSFSSRSGRRSGSRGKREGNRTNRHDAHSPPPRPPGGQQRNKQPRRTVNPDYARINAAAQQEDPKSLLSWYRALIALRRREPVLRAGSYRRVSALGSPALCYLRETASQRVYVALNFARGAQEIPLPDGATWSIILGSHHPEGRALEGGALTLPGYGIVIARAAG
jgi:glycosidase